jgi:nicotinamidase-related amidase
VARAGGLVVHTREAHKPDLSDCPPAKRNRGNPKLRIGDAGPMGRILVAGEPGNQIIPALAPVPARSCSTSPARARSTPRRCRRCCSERGITHLLFMGVTTEVCVQTSMREANDRGYDGLLLEDCTESYFPQFKAATLEMIRAQGAIVGWTAPARSCCDALARPLAVRPVQTT